MIAGTVFRDPGFALPGAEVEVARVAPPESGRRPKPLRSRTDGRGEFAFQVPPEPAEYRVTARARGYVMEEKVVRLSGGPERVDVYLTLKPAGSNQK
ncbi:MAG: carboxypeptidase-like regulatory domain-containing protein [Bryobacteraceae bacterium]|nr:carboxypeptidase-like regulatory domain-containing protein [Bryobacteraceae bacterium]